MKSLPYQLSAGGSPSWHTAQSFSRVPDVPYRLLNVDWYDEKACPPVGIAHATRTTHNHSIRLNMDTVFVFMAAVVARQN
jgi:hypothetical protein